MKLRVLVLLVVAILATTPHPAALTATPATITTEAPAAEPDVLDTALRPPARQGNRPAPSLRPALRTRAAHPAPEPHPLPVQAPPSHNPTLHALRCVVLRC
ncbi:hypothetical protein [Streptomyces sp. NBC_00038]|uniref:hypothetical protein n=1 Tax=Streptomyces sp. NBC_00038 TaxID=2903615 RepID=UPI002250817C|nr:hypothetical protein [Streptomyces sp. NBC_00038]MCX5558889.1 hypothetical protein [Streptomyces sp. NBC_00038]